MLGVADGRGLRTRLAPRVSSLASNDGDRRTCEPSESQSSKYSGLAPTPNSGMCSSSNSNSIWPPSCSVSATRLRALADSAASNSAWSALTTIALSASPPTMSTTAAPPIR